MEKNSKKIAVLITCYNRKAKTLNSLDALYHSVFHSGVSADVFLVNDGSTDGTKEAVKNSFPKVNIINGDGSLYWTGGMRLAWDTAVKKNDYDFYFWLNDDTNLFEFAISEIMECYYEAFNSDENPALIVGACQGSENDPIFSYGGRNENSPVIPNGKLQSCRFVNGNAVLVSKEVHKVLGNLSTDYTHSMGDFDYGLRAQQNGFNCYSTKNFVAVCAPNEVPDWQNAETSLMERLKLLHSPRGLNLKEYNKFRKKFWGYKWIIFAIKAYLKVLSPSLYKKVSQNY